MKTPLATLVGHRIRRLRVAQGLTVADLAERAGMARRQVCRIELGRVLARALEQRRSVARSLGVPLASLLAATPPDDPLEQYPRLAVALGVPLAMLFDGLLEATGAVAPAPTSDAA